MNIQAVWHRVRPVGGRPYAPLWVAAIGMHRMEWARESPVGWVYRPAILAPSRGRDAPSMSRW